MINVFTLTNINTKIIKDKLRKIFISQLCIKLVVALRINRYTRHSSQCQKVGDPCPIRTIACANLNSFTGSECAFGNVAWTLRKLPIPFVEQWMVRIVWNEVWHESPDKEGNICSVSVKSFVLSSAIEQDKCLATYWEAGLRMPWHTHSTRRATVLATLFSFKLNAGYTKFR